MTVSKPALIRAVSNSDLDALHFDWRYRTIDALRGNQSPLGTVLLAVLGRQQSRLPRLGTQAYIDAAGIVHVDFWDEHGDHKPASPLNSVKELTDSFRYLADELKLSDADREAMFGELRKWIKRDYRIASGEVDQHGELLAPEPLED